MTEAGERTVGFRLRRFRRYPDYEDSGIEWLGEIPAHWGSGTIKSLAREGHKTFVDGDWIESPYITDDGVRLIQTGNIGIGEFREKGFRYISQRTFEDFACTEFEPGDILICRLGDPVARACLAPQLGKRMITSVDVCILKPRDGIHAKFLVYLMSCDRYLSWVGSLVRGSTRDRVSRSMLGSFAVPLPSLDEQDSIADYLDRETATIDALVERKERLIELLQEKRTALITHAVTRGLEPSVPMKDSGVEWLGAIPTHWETLALSRVAISRCDGPFGSGLKAEHYSESGVRVVRLQNIGWAEFMNSDAAYLDEAYARRLGDHSVKCEDILIAGLGDEGHPVGRACVAPITIEPAMVKADCFRFRLDRRRVLPRYAAFQLSATASGVAGYHATGATRTRVNLANCARRMIVLPPLNEQEAIATFLDHETTRIDTLLDKVRQAIDRLNEYRAALISAAVTGKIDVQNEAA